MKIVWKIYCVVYFRCMMLGHWVKGDITLPTFLTLLLLPRMRPRDFDYFKGLTHPPAKFPGTQ